jgi:hypothetical protein
MCSVPSSYAEMLLKNAKAEIESPRALADPSCSLAMVRHIKTHI